MEYKSIDEPLEFNKEFAHDGDIYLYQSGKLIYVGNTIPEPSRPSLLSRIKSCLWNKKGGGNENMD